MFYLFLIAGAFYILFRSAEHSRTTITVLISVLTLVLLYLWSAYLTWDNPSGDPHGSMFRGIELLVLFAVTTLFGFVSWKRTRVELSKGDEAFSTRPRWIFILLALVLSAVLYLAFTYFN